MRKSFHSNTQREVTVLSFFWSVVLENKSKDCGNDNAAFKVKKKHNSLGNYIQVEIFELDLHTK